MHRVLNDPLLSGFIFCPLALAVITTLVGAALGNAKKGAIVGLGLFVVPPLLIAALLWIAYAAT